MLWQIEQGSKHDHWTHAKQICSINSATFGLKFDYRTRASSNLIICQAIFRHSTGNRRMYHFLAIFRQSDRDPTNVVVFLLHCQCTPKMATLQCTPYLPTWILRVKKEVFAMENRALQNSNAGTGFGVGGKYPSICF